MNAAGSPVQAACRASRQPRACAPTTTTAMGVATMAGRFCTAADCAWAVRFCGAPQAGQRPAPGWLVTEHCQPHLSDATGTGLPPPTPPCQSLCIHVDPQCPLERGNPLCPGRWGTRHALRAEPLAGISWGQGSQAGWRSSCPSECACVSAKDACQQGTCLGLGRWGAGHALRADRLAGCRRRRGGRGVERGTGGRVRRCRGPRGRHWCAAHAGRLGWAPQRLRGCRGPVHALASVQDAAGRHPARAAEGCRGHTSVAGWPACAGLVHWLQCRTVQGLQAANTALSAGSPADTHDAGG